MANEIRWYLCPLVPHPSGDPFLPKVPDSWINTAPGRTTTVKLPNFDICVLRINADSVDLDNLINGSQPQGFFRLRPGLTWGDLTLTQKNYVLTRWPNIQVNDTDKLWQIINRLAQQSNPLFSVVAAAIPELDGGATEE